MLKSTIEHCWDGRVLPEADRVSVTLSTHGTENEPTLTITVDAPYYSNKAPMKTDNACICLWDFEVVEVFIKGRMDKYIEIEMNPHGEYLILAMDGHKQCFHESLKPLQYEAHIRGKRWSAKLVIPFSYLPPPLVCTNCPLFCFNAFAMHDDPVSKERRHLALFPSTGGYDEPDFHRLHFFEGLPLSVTGKLFEDSPDKYAAHSHLWNERLGADFLDSARCSSVE